MTGPTHALAFGETLDVTLPAPIGTLTLLASNAAFSRFRQLTRERGIGPLGPTDEAGKLLPGARPRGVELRGTGEWHYIDEETFPLLLWVLGQQHRPSLSVAVLEEVCTPIVQAGVIEPVLRYVGRVLVRLCKPDTPAAGGAGPANPPPGSTPTEPTGTNGGTASGS